MRSRALRTAIAALLVGVVGVTAHAAPRKHVLVDGNRTRAVHTIPLYDENYREIRPDDEMAMPFSTKNTCGDCHDYDKIAMGRHFNSSMDVTDPGRPGEPWVLVDENAGVQLPLSYRGWPGTWKPQDVGMTEWDFVKTFGHKLPGGDMGEKEEATPNPKARWEISGKLEINCLACHNTSDEENISEWAIQVGRENFRWAATGASGIGSVLNMASRLPEYYDLLSGRNKDNAWAAVPEVKYKRDRFNSKNCVFFDVNRNGNNNRCYYCHSSVPKNVDPQKIWAWDGDVHLLAGLTCTDCHRNGLDHTISRGYEGESRNPAYSTLTCRGCHLGDPAGDGFEFKGGRMRAPRPLHRGLPPVHLEKLSCTACHSGFLPGDKTERIRTARANRLGIHGRAQWDTELPYIMAPVFVRQAGGKIEPHEIMWPAFWGSIKGDKVTPLPLETVAPLIKALRDAEKKAKDEKDAAAQAAAAPAAAPADAEAKPAEGQAPAEGEAKPAKKDGDNSAGESDPAKPAEGDAKAKEEPKAEAKEPGAPEPVVDEIAPLTEAQIAQVLSQLGEAAGADAKPVYVAGGKLYQLASDGTTLTASDNAAAQPYSWAFAHDVRPASQSLGARGCSDCHEKNSNFFFGEVEPAAPAAVGKTTPTPMYAMAQLDPKLLTALDAEVDLRIVFIVAAIALSVILAVALLHYGFIGFEGFLRLLAGPGGKK